MKDINEIASELDEVIEKGNEVKKALTFDILKPHDMSEMARFHNPYQLLPDGSYMPWPEEFWVSQTATYSEELHKLSDGYREVREFYGQGGDAWSKFRRSIDNQFKKGLPIGTIHTFKDGKEYRKESENHWVPVGTGEHHARMMDPEQSTTASHEIESDARSKKVQDELESRKFGKELAQETANKLLEAEAKSDKTQETKPGKSETKDEKKRKKVKKDEKAGMQAQAAGDSFPEGETQTDPKIQPINHQFSRLGKEISVKDAEDYIDRFEKDFKELTTMDNVLKDSGATHFASRLKDRLSLFNKMKDRYKEKPLNAVADVIGARGLTETLQEQKKMLEGIKKNYELVEVEDFADKGWDTGYRAVHIMFKTPTGLLGELQLKTHRQQIFSGFTHDQIYKGKKEIQESKEVKKYTKDLSDYLYGLDKGKKDNPKKRPKEPEILLKNGIEFPWDEIAEFGELGAAIKTPEMKYYAVVRHPVNRTALKVREFESFKEAKKFKQDTIESGHKGEVPIAYSKSMQEFLETFTEYKPKKEKKAKSKAKPKAKPKSKDGVFDSEEIPKGVKVPDQHKPADEIDKEVGENHRLNNLRSSGGEIHYHIKDGKVVGHVGLDEEGRVKALYVDPDQRRKGIAENMYQEIAKKNGSITSDDPDAMEPGAKALWKKLEKQYPDRVSKDDEGRYVLTSKAKKSLMNEFVDQLLDAGVNSKIIREVIGTMKEQYGE